MYFIDGYYLTVLRMDTQKIIRTISLDEIKRLSGRDYFIFIDLLTTGSVRYRHLPGRVRSESKKWVNLNPSPSMLLSKGWKYAHTFVQNNKEYDVYRKKNYINQYVFKRSINTDKIIRCYVDKNNLCLEIDRVKINNMQNNEKLVPICEFYSDLGRNKSKKFADLLRKITHVTVNYKSETNLLSLSYKPAVHKVYVFKDQIIF